MRKKMQNHYKPYINGHEKYFNGKNIFDLCSPDSTLYKPTHFLTIQPIPETTARKANQYSTKIVGLN
jgi:hypothetical protein